MQRRQFLAGLGIGIGSIAFGRRAIAQQGVGGAASTAAKDAARRGRRLDGQALEDTLVGSSYMGCGGGGSLEAARGLIERDLAEGLEFRRLDLARLGDDEFAASPYTLESLAPMGADMQARLEEIGGPSDAPTIASFRLLEKTLGRTFAAVIVGEIGPLSMAEALSLAARLGIPSLDADTVGRATPEINQHSVRVAGHPITPAAAVTLFGDEVILSGVRHPSREEVVFRALSVVSRLVGVTDAAIPGSVAKAEHVLVQGSLTLAGSIGRAVREARAADGDAIEAARRAGGGYHLFEGRVARRDGSVIATCPDLITLVDRESGLGIDNPGFREGQRVAVLGFRAPELWRRPEGLAVFAPR